jgi:ABC-type phosphate transport system permease subunit
VKRGDVNGDGFLTAADAAIVAANLALATTAYGFGDVDGSGSVDAADQQIVAEALAGLPSVPVLGPWGAALFAAGLAAHGARRLRGREGAHA